MFRNTLLLATFACGAAASGCQVEQGQAFIQGVLPLVGPECTAGAAFQSGAILDIGIDAGSANNLIFPVQVTTNLPSTFSSQTLTEDKTKSPNYPNYGNTDENVITFNQSEVFFSTDEDRDGQLALDGGDGTPVTRDNQRVSTVSGVAFNEQTQLLTPSVVFTTGITKGDATLLQAQQFITDSIGAGGSAHIIVNLRLVGTTTGGSRIETPPFPFPVDLCQGCLVADRATDLNCGIDDKNTADPGDDTPIVAIPNPAQCIRGVNVPNFVCP